MPTSLCLTLIAAVAKNRVIGMGNRLPWHLPEDLRHFRAVTRGHPVIMGRKTWESLPEAFRPLPGRLNVVISRQPDYPVPGGRLAASLPAALALVAAPTANHAVRQDTAVRQDAFIIGGEQLYALALPRADRLMLTEIEMAVVGDAWFPAFSADEWREVQRERQVGADGVAFAFVTYERRKRNQG